MLFDHVSENVDSPSELLLGDRSGGPVMPFGQVPSPCVERPQSSDHLDIRLSLPEAFEWVAFTTVKGITFRSHQLRIS